MATPKTHMTSSAGMFTCPGCKADVYGRMTIELDIDNDVDMTGPNFQLTGKVIGCSVSHDCTPKVTR